MEGLDGGERPAPFLRVRNGLGLLERIVARADCLGEFILIEFGRLRLPPAGRDVFGGDGDREVGFRDGDREAGFREGERRGGRAQGLEADLLQGMSDEPALELNPIFGGALARLELSMVALAPSTTRLSSSRIEASMVAMSSRRLASPSARCGKVFSNLKVASTNHASQVLSGSP